MYYQGCHCIGKVPWNWELGDQFGYATHNLFALLLWYQLFIKDSIVLSLLYLFVCLFQWRIQELKNGGGRGPGAVEFCFDNPSHIPYVLVDRVVNKIHNVNIVYWLKSKYMRVIQLKFTKTNPIFFFKTGGEGARRSWIRLCIWIYMETINLLSLFIPAGFSHTKY